MNNPLFGTDPTGYIFETPWDAFSIVYDVAKIGYGYAMNNPQLVSDGLVDLAADTAALFVPGLPAGTTKVGRALEDVASVSNRATKSVTKVTNGKVSNIGSEAEKSVDAARKSGQGYGRNGAAGAAEVTDDVAAITGKSIILEEVKIIIVPRTIK